MSIGTKQRIVWIGLVVFAIWPLVHFGVVRMTELSPWKGFGWAMYCVPGRIIMVRVNSIENGSPLSIARSRYKSPDFLRVFNEFVGKRKAVGAWAEPDDFSRVLFEEFPDVEGVVIVVDQVGIDRTTGLAVVERTDRYPYRRETAPK